MSKSKEKEKLNTQWQKISNVKERPDHRVRDRNHALCTAYREAKDGKAEVVKIKESSFRVEHIFLWFTTINMNVIEKTVSGRRPNQIN